MWGNLEISVPRLLMTDVVRSTFLQIHEEDPWAWARELLRGPSSPPKSQAFTVEDIFLRRKEAIILHYVDTAIFWVPHFWRCFKGDHHRHKQLTESTRR